MATSPQYNGHIRKQLQKHERVGPATDLTKWRLTNERGRQTWEYDEHGLSAREPNFVERHALGLDLVRLHS